MSVFGPIAILIILIGVPSCYRRYVSMCDTIDLLSLEIDKLNGIDITEDLEDWNYKIQTRSFP